MIFRKVSLCFVAFATVLCLLCACKSKNTDGNGENREEGDSVIFSSEHSVTLVRPKGVDLPLKSVSDGIFNVSGKHAGTMEDDCIKSSNEIVFGATSREISSVARQKMDLQLSRIRESLEEEGKSAKYSIGVLFYAQGDTLAVVWSDDVAVDYAINYLISNFITAAELRLETGYTKFVELNSLELMKAEENENREAQYAKISETYGAQVAEAVRTHLGMFDERYYMWLADLYDPGEYDEEGNPLGGGFYFSNSGRDTPGFGVDLESTAQVLAFLTSSGMLKNDSDFLRLFPEKMQKEMVAFALSCQSPVDGYFYHPQWGTDVKDSRRSRDCGWAVRILRYFGTLPYWNTPAGAEGQYGDPPGVEPVSALSSKLSHSSVSAVSKVISTAGGKKWTGSSQLKTLDAWRDYLENLTKDIRTKSYNIGNTVASQAEQINNREKIALSNGEENGYIAAFEEYFNRYQLENGLWEECSVEDGTVYYNAINGLMKISGGYNSLGVKMNHAEEAIRAAAYMVTYIGTSRDGSDWADSKDKKPDGSVDVYNPWVCINNVLSNVKEHDGEDAANELRNAIIKPHALEMVKATSRKIALFARDDGSYCYNWGPAGSTSQGAQVAVGGVMEGDVNGGNIAFTGTYREMSNALGFGSLKPFGYSDFYKFVDRIEELDRVIKDDVTVELGAGEFDFDDDAVGTVAPSDVTLSMNTGSVEVVADNREGAFGNVLKFTTLSGKGSTATYKPASVKNALGVSLEWEMCFENTGDKDGTLFQIRIGDGYMVTVGIDKNGMMTIGDASSTGTGISNKFDIELDPKEWNKFRAEFYILDSESRSTIAKIYVNDELRFVSNNYFGKESALTPTMKYTYAKFYGLASYEFTCYFDNIVAKALANPYVEEPIVNPDRIKDFEGGGLPNGVTTEGGVIENDGNSNALVLDGAEKSVEISSTVASGSANCYALSTKMKIDASTAGTVAKLYLAKSDASKSIAAYEIVIYEDGEKLLARLVEFDRDGNKGASFDGLPVGTWFELTVEFYPYFYESDQSSIVYLDGNEIGRGNLNYYIGTVAGPYAKVILETLAKVKISLDDVIPESIEKAFKNEDGTSASDPDVTLPEMGASTDTKENADHNGKFDFEGYELGTPKVPGLRTVVNTDEYENRIEISEDPVNAVNRVIKHNMIKSSSGCTSYFKASTKSSDNANCYVYSYDIYFDYFSGGGIQCSIKGKIGGDEVNMYQNNINISSDDGAGSITLKTKKDSAGDLAEGEEKHPSTIVIPATKFSGWVNIRYELYTDEGIMQIYYDDQFRGETDIVYDIRMDAELYRATIFTTKDSNATIYYDNVVVEAIEKAYEKKTPVDSSVPVGDGSGSGSSGGNTDGEQGGQDNPGTTPEAPIVSGVYDFEDSQTGTFDIYGISGRFTNGSATVMEDPRNSVGKVLDYYTYSGANEALTFTSKTVDNAKTFVLSFDMYLKKWAEEGGLMQIKLDSSYMICISVKNGQIRIEDASTTSGGSSYCKTQTLASGIDIEKWHSYRIEYAVIDGMAYIKLYVDGTVVAVSGNYYDGNGENGKPSFVYTKATFSSLSKAEFSASFDNVSAVQSDMAMEKADYTHFVHLVGSRFEYTPITDAHDFEDGAVSGGIIGTPQIGDANYISSSVITDVKSEANKVLRINIDADATCKATSTYTNTLTPSNLDKTKDADGNYIQGKGAYVFSYDFRYDGIAPTSDAAITDVIFYHSPKISSSYWNFIQLLMTKNGALKIKMGNNLSDTPNRSFVREGGVIGDGEWHNIRIIAEKCGADSVISVFLDNACVVYRLNCYYDSGDVDANSYISSVLWRQRKTGFDFAIELDNVYFEYAGDYDILSGFVK